MIRRLFVCLFILTAGRELFAQQHHVFIEFGGVGHFGSLNYEIELVEKSHLKVGARIGLTSINVMDYRRKFNPDVVVPIGPTLTIGSTHSFEADLLSIYSSTVYANHLGINQRNNKFSGGAFVGYRYQKDESKFVFRAGYSPIYESFNTFRHWAALSIGYQF